MFVNATLGSVADTQITGSQEKHFPTKGELLMQQHELGRRNSVPGLPSPNQGTEFVQVALAENPLESTGSPYRTLPQMFPVWQ